MRHLAKMLFLGCAAGLSAAAHSASDAAESLQQAVTAACEDSSSSLEEMAGRMPGGASAVSEEPLAMRGMEIGWKRRFALPDGSEIRIEQFAPQGRLRRLTAEYWSLGPDGDPRPELAAIAGPDCAVGQGRRLVYDADSSEAAAIEHLDQDLQSLERIEPLSPTVPEGEDPGGVPVAHVDSGVNYLLPDIARRLARDESGSILGYDFWDMNRRPFDSNPAQSPFFPQRHGTRTGGLLLREAPEARLVPYRYPRPDMERMADLIADAAEHGVRIINISMGSDDLDDWRAFARAAEANPDMLFVVSAGNNGWDIDRQPIYPAALPLENTIVVTSALPNGQLARGSNWGTESVDLLVPAERLRVTDFDGNDVVASGSSYAAVRVSALAARLLAINPGWGAPELRAAIFERVLPAFSDNDSGVSQGFIPRPEMAENLPPLSSAGDLRERERQVLTGADLYGADHPAPSQGYALEPTLVYFGNSGWSLDALRVHAQEAAQILGQCGIHVPRAGVRMLEGPAVFHYFHDLIGIELVRQMELPKPTVYFVTDTLQPDPYDAEAIGRSNSRTRPALRDTVWFTEATRDPGIALAHELVHVLMDSGEHVEKPGNLMRPETSAGNTALTSRQCDAVVSTGVANGLLTPLD
ncbi:MAG: S8 family serine peptidase [Rhodobacteraceae bacterium]|nr:S8 family serine peptidase [Paracoccaceae bacterium]